VAGAGVAVGGRRLAGGLVEYLSNSLPRRPSTAPPTYEDATKYDNRGFAGDSEDCQQQVDGDSPPPAAPPVYEAAADLEEISVTVHVNSDQPQSLPPPYVMEAAEEPSAEEIEMRSEIEDDAEEQRDGQEAGGDDHLAGDDQVEEEGAKSDR